MARVPSCPGVPPGDPCLPRTVTRRCATLTAVLDSTKSEREEKERDKERMRRVPGCSCAGEASRG